MNKFIWVRDREKREHYLNVEHIVRVTKVPPKSPYSEYSYIVVNDGCDKQQTLELSNDEHDTFQDVIEKIIRAQNG